MERLTDVIQAMNEYNQKTITGKLTLKGDEILLNCKNSGLAPMDPEWDEDISIKVLKGTCVNYNYQETVFEDVHEITYKRDGKRYHQLVSIPK